MGKGKGLFAVALVGVLTLSATGEEPLSLVIPKATLPSVVTAVEPSHEAASVTLAGAARQNDFAAFEALYAAHPNPAFADLHALWSYSQTERVGAFYGEELHSRLARRYPGFAAYIDEYKIVDSHGTAFWPTAETRTFLLDRALKSDVPVASPILIATTKAHSRPVAKVAAKAKVAKAKPVAKVAQHKPVAKPRVKAVAAQKPVVTQNPTVAQQPIVSQKPIVAQPVAQAPTLVQAAPAPIAEAPKTDRSGTGRGVLLMILGLIGVGVLTLMLRTPADEQPADAHPQEEPPAKIPTLLNAETREGLAAQRSGSGPLKLTSLPQNDQQPQRKTGSHG